MDKRIKTLLYVILLIIALVIIGYSTNSGIERHGDSMGALFKVAFG